MSIKTYLDFLNEKEEEPKYWGGHVGSKDDFGDEIGDTFIDGKTTMGPWGIMTPKSHKTNGVGIGEGKGQKYQKQADGKWLKIR